MPPSNYVSRLNSPFCLCPYTLFIQSSCVPFYAFAASPMLAFLKKLQPLESVSVIVDELEQQSHPNDNPGDGNGNVNNNQFVRFDQQFNWKLAGSFLYFMVRL